MDYKKENSTKLFDLKKSLYQEKEYRAKYVHFQRNCAYTDEEKRFYAVKIRAANANIANILAAMNILLTEG